MEAETRFVVQHSKLPSVTRAPQGEHHLEFQLLHFQPQYPFFKSVVTLIFRKKKISIFLTWHLNSSTTCMIYSVLGCNTVQFFVLLLECTLHGTHVMLFLMSVCSLCSFELQAFLYTSLYKTFLRGQPLMRIWVGSWLHSGFQLPC